MNNYDEQFNLRKRHPLGRFHLFANVLQSKIARQTLLAELDICYGDTSGQKIDVFPAKQANSPVFVFIHGGYFRALDKKQYSYMAKPFVAAGYTVALINYDLAPKVAVKDIVEQNIQALQWIYNNIKSFNGDPSHIVLSGHSVGAFLVAKLLEKDWQSDITSSIKGAVLLSGIFDLTKLRKSYLNQDLRLTEQDVNGLSPVFNSPRCIVPTIVAVGDNETQEFITQSKQYADKLAADNSNVQYMLLQNKNHYTVSRMLSFKTNVLMAAISKLIVD